MTKFLDIAEEVYAEFEEKNLFSENPIEQLNNLVSVIRTHLKGTSCKLKNNYIDFEECLSKAPDQCLIKLDISLMPKYKNKLEYIMWLASFIERITVGGRPKLPPLSSLLPNSNKSGSDVKVDREEERRKSEESANLIKNYFNSEDFKKIAYS
ncbi:hypothetical protein A1Z85_RS11015 [Acinetobacter baumannii]|uniref:hypothetical protein n=1 Tax=Acinetobacter baumannii TaxID=470 RepID=UPI00028D17A2|nr:hypothetical protein [Acinetobacter baumannii]EHU1441327.1 hypothetical protein [Acinetobacter baumannii]EHU1809147.1 hypothetical protein [Acinetobacter baumannii]EHU2698535.1 hypothetical protein [Acinetobacter baumannii]EKL59519.1 hypothetical protein ACIN5110_2346 [Acinetobacter baumannii OIFC110]TPT82251.1 hypothetical protein FJU55_17095 [Acinetobacter baumannii]